ncbi:MAG: hypothetical protein IJX50_03880 [Clostridia bacterium]|nr:hypothetical protein [Clostridia bacterium]
MKKLISLILTLALMSTVFGTVAMAEETFSKTVAAAATDNPMEVLWVSQNTTTGVQTITSKTWSSDSNPVINSNNWVLWKINVGKNLVFNTMKFTTRIQLTGSSNTYVYVAPLSYIDYEAAATAKANGTTLTTLVKPVNGGTNVAPRAEIKRSGSGESNATVTLNAALFNNSEYYHDGYVYLALTAADGTDTTPQLSLKADKMSNWKLAITGTVVEAPAVDDFSDAEITLDNDGNYTVTTTTTTGTAMLIAASFNGTTMVDAKVATINAANAVEGVISGTIEGLADGTVKLFLWDSTTLAPAINVTTP